REVKLDLERTEDEVRAEHAVDHGVLHDIFELVGHAAGVERRDALDVRREEEVEDRIERHLELRGPVDEMPPEQERGIAERYAAQRLEAVEVEVRRVVPRQRRAGRAAE